MTQDDNTCEVDQMHSAAEVKSTERSYRLALRALGRPHLCRETQVAASGHIARRSLGFDEREPDAAVSVKSEDVWFAERLCPMRQESRA